MSEFISVNDQQMVIPSTDSTILDVITSSGQEFFAPCGGNGSCGKCTVKIELNGSVWSALSCQTKAQPDMKVSFGTKENMNIATQGMIHSYLPDNQKESLYGIACDLGTTTIAVALVDMTTGGIVDSIGAPNPQSSYGADVIARISQASDGKLSEMAEVVRKKIASMISELCKKHCISGADELPVSLAGNTTMQHILCELSPETIGVNPFTPLSYFGSEQYIAGIERNVYLARCLSGYVGGDITAGILACDFIHTDELSLLIDLGTNGEIALGNSSRIVSCATAAGPVFEGANIECGSPSVAGAISHISVEEGKVKLSVIEDIAPTCLCGTGIIDAMAFALEQGLCDETGYLYDRNEVASSNPYKDMLSENDGKNCLIFAPGVYLTQEDVRNIQLAKAAICAGIYTLLGEFGTTPEEVKHVYIAGGFGQFLDVTSAVRIGLIPEVLEGCTQSIGNSSLQGAIATLISSQAKDDVALIVNLNTYVELSTSKEFNNYYIDCMMFPE